MLADKKGANFYQLLFKSHHVIECLFVNDTLTELIEDFDQLFMLIDVDLVTLHYQTLHLLSGMKEFGFPINFSRHGLVKVRPSKSTMMFRQHGTC